MTTVPNGLPVQQTLRPDGLVGTGLVSVSGCPLVLIERSEVRPRLVIGCSVPTRPSAKSLETFGAGWSNSVSQIWQRELGLNTPHQRSADTMLCEVHSFSGEQSAEGCTALEYPSLAVSTARRMNALVLKEAMGMGFAEHHRWHFL